MRYGLRLALLAVLLLAGPALARDIPARSRFFTTSDGVRLHYLEAGPSDGRVIVFVPGWTMPAWIWGPQLDAFSRQYRVIAFDPRGQGESEVPASGYEPVRRGEDIGELIDQLSPSPVLAVGWSLGVLDLLAYLHSAGDRRLAGLVLVDNSVGELPAPTPPAAPRLRRPGQVFAPVVPHPLYLERFVRSMFLRPPGEAYLERLTNAALRTPEAASRALLRYPVPRSYWREAIYATDKPVLYLVRPRLAAQADNLARNRPNTVTEVYSDAGHALFVDDAPRFNADMADFIHRHVWP